MNSGNIYQVINGIITKSILIKEENLKMGLPVKYNINELNDHKILTEEEVQNMLLKIL